MNRENYLVGYLKKANEKPDNDHLLSYGMAGQMRGFRNKQIAENEKVARLKHFEKIDISISPIFEAVYLFGKWIIEKDFQSALKSISKFHEMELIAYERKWFSVLIFCIKEQINLCFKLSKDDDLKTISERLTKYLNEGKRIFPTHIFVKLIDQFTRLLEKEANETIERIYDLIMDYCKDTTLHYTFREQLLKEGIKIKKFQKEDDTVGDLHRKILDLKLTEAEERGKTGKLIHSSFLEEALDYCVKYVGDKELTTSIKRKISEIDYTDELVKIKLPIEEKKKIEEAIKKKGEILEKAISDYIDKAKEFHPLQILYNVCNDESLIMMKVIDTKKFTEKLMKEHPIQHILSKTLYSEERRRRIDDLAITT